MFVKSQSKFFPALLSHRQYSGTISTLLHNWPIFAGALFFGLVALAVSALLAAPWRWFLLAGGLGTLGLMLSILVASYLVYDWGSRRDYDRLAELGDMGQANVVIDLTCGKLRSTRGVLSRFQPGHYFLIDLYDAEKMKDYALRRARELEPPLETKQRIYRRSGQANRLPLPHNWADIIFCAFSLHEFQDTADREAILAECARVLKPHGRLLIAEHDRDWLNTLIFGPGVFSFFPAAEWEQHMTRAGLAIKHHERWRGLVHLWVASRKPG
ncbi:MAG TPA: class I SAM-dependent methyltransferase [Anaerolineae bacterium]